MTRIAFVARQVDRAIDVDRQIGVDLDQALEVALIPVVAAPRLVGDVLDREALLHRQVDAAACGRGSRGSPPGTRDRAGRRDDERLLEAIVALDQRAARPAASPSSCASTASNSAAGLRRRHRVVERQRLLVEGQLLALQHRDARSQRGELARQVLPAQRPHFGVGTLGAWDRRCAASCVSVAAACVIDRRAAASSRPPPPCATRAGRRTHRRSRRRAARRRGPASRSARPPIDTDRGAGACALTESHPPGLRHSQPGTENREPGTLHFA